MPVSIKKTYSKTIEINTAPGRLWKVLTRPSLMKQWVFDGPTDILTDWKVGGPIKILVPADSYKGYFENKGTVLRFEPERLLKYSHLRSLSNLPDHIENYAILTFTLIPQGEKTCLTLTLSNFATETIYQHLAFYWGVTLELIKKRAEAD